MAVTVAPIVADIPEYNRGDWKYWQDCDKDYQDIRHEGVDSGMGQNRTLRQLSAF